MTMRNALEFVQDVVDAVKAASGVDVQAAIEACSVSFAAHDVDAERRRDALRGVFSGAFTEKEVGRLLSCPHDTEAANVARTILTGATWLFRRKKMPQFYLAELVLFAILSLMLRLTPSGILTYGGVFIGASDFDESVH